MNTLGVNFRFIAKRFAFQPSKATSPRVSIVTLETAKPDTVARTIIIWAAFLAQRRFGAALPLLTGVFVAAITPFSLAASEVSGQIEVIGRDKKTSAAAGAVVWMPGVNVSGIPTVTPSMASKDKRFDPHVLIVPQGVTVSFPNYDKIHHNVFSRTPGSEFDLGLYRSGKSKEFRFAAPGLVHIYCNIHAEMAGYIMVTDGFAYAIADAEGRFRIEGVPEGRREVRIWHERAGETTAFVSVSAGHTAPVHVVLDASNYRESGHKNKYGEDYPPVALDDDRY